MPELPYPVGGQPISTNLFGVPVVDRVVSRYLNAADRDSKVPTPQRGHVAYVEDIKQLQIHDGVAWVPFVAADGTTPMGAALDMATHKVIKLGAATADDEAAQLGQAVRKDQVRGADQGNVGPMPMNWSGWGDPLTQPPASVLRFPMTAYANVTYILQIDLSFVVYRHQNTSGNLPSFECRARWDTGAAAVVTGAITQIHDPTGQLWHREYMGARWTGQVTGVGGDQIYIHAQLNQTGPVNSADYSWQNAYLRGLLIPMTP